MRYRIYHNGRRIDGLHGRVTEFFRKVWFWIKVSASAAFVGSLIYGAGFITAATNKVEATNTTTVVDRLPEKINALKMEVIQKLSDCERGGHTEEDGLVTFDPDRSGKQRNMPSFGVLQFKVPTVVQYMKKLNGKDVSDKEAILLALDEDRASALAKQIIFDEPGGIWNWKNCTINLGLDTKVTIIKELTK